MYIFIQHAKMNISVENRDRDAYWNTHSEKTTIAPVVSISMEQMCLHLAYGPDFCKWATPIEITVKFNSDVISEPGQFKPIWCYRVCRLNKPQATEHKMSEEPVNVFYIYILLRICSGLQSLVVDFSYHIVCLLLSL